MKAIQDPRQESWGMSYIPTPTEEFSVLLEKAMEKIEPFSYKERCTTTVYFKVKNEEVGSEYDTCDQTKCIESSKKSIRIDYGKGTRIEEVWYDNDGDHERIETCSQCEIPLNEFMTWCRSELEHLEESCQPWDAKSLKKEGGLVYAILQSMPTMDNDISGDALHIGGEILKKALEQREEFFQRIVKLAEAVMSADFESEIKTNQKP